MSILDTTVINTKIKMCHLKNSMIEFWKGERGEANIVSIIIILGVVVALAVVFRKNITNLFDKIWKSISDSFAGFNSVDPAKEQGF